LSSGYVAILTAELHFPDAHSLKGKRHFVRSARDTLRSRFGASVAEVDHHDLWQRARLTVALVDRHQQAVGERLDAAERLACAQWYEATRFERAIVTPEDLQ
jgi:uncharacterized protein YlxP (DUF503 family)